MNNNTIITIIIVTIIVFFLYNKVNESEGFQSDILYNYYPTTTGQISTAPYIAIANHIRVNKFNEVENITTKPPLPDEGEVECIKMSCPSYYPGNAICWKGW